MSCQGRPEVGFYGASAANVRTRVRSKHSPLRLTEQKGTDVFEILDTLRVTPCIGTTGVDLCRGDIVMLRTPPTGLEDALVCRAVVLTRNNLEIWITLSRLKREARPVPPLKALAMFGVAGMPEL